MKASTFSFIEPGGGGGSAHMIIASGICFQHNTLILRDMTFQEITLLFLVTRCSVPLKFFMQVYETEITE